MKIEHIATDAAPTPKGHYSQAVVHDNVIYVSGQVAVDPATGERRTGSIEEQTERTLENLRAVLKAAGSDLNLVLKMTIYVTDIDQWAQVNATYARIMGDARPARAVVPVGDLGDGLLIEIEAIAALS